MRPPRSVENRSATLQHAHVTAPLTGHGADSTVPPRRAATCARVLASGKVRCSPSSPCSALTGLRVAPGGCAPPIPCAARPGALRGSGRRASRQIDAKRACRPGVEQRAAKDEEGGERRAAPAAARNAPEAAARALGTPPGQNAGGGSNLSASGRGRLPLLPVQHAVRELDQMQGCLRLAVAVGVHGQGDQVASQHACAGRMGTRRRAGPDVGHGGLLPRGHGRMGRTSSLPQGSLPKDEREHAGHSARLRS